LEPIAAASIHQTAKCIVVSALARTTVGVWIGSEPAVAVPLDATADVLGRRVLDALAGSRAGVPHPTDWRARDEVLLRAAGETSIRSFNRGARTLSVTRTDEVFTLHPTKRGARRGSYLPAREREFTIPADADARAVGMAVRQALAECEPW
jgi:hypothetical protein